MKATKGFSVNDWCRNFEINFQGEQGMFYLEKYIVFIWKKVIFNILFQGLIGVVSEENGLN